MTAEEKVIKLQEIALDLLKKYEKASIDLIKATEDPDTADDLIMTGVIPETGDYLRQLAEINNSK